MARSLNKKFFGPSTDAGSQIAVTADIGAGPVAAYIVKQVSARRYLVSDGVTMDGDELLMVKCKLVNGAPAAPGEARIQFTPFGGVATNAMKITAKKVISFAGVSYTWSALAANEAGEASLIPAADQTEVTATATATLATTGVILTVTMTSGGTGYSVSDVLTVAGGTGNGATITVATVNTGVIATVTVSNGGTGYTVGDSLTVTGNGDDNATFTVASISAAVASYTVTNSGSGYTGAPAVTVSGNATATAVVSNGIVTNVNVNAAGSGYTSAPTVTIAAP
jgi:hypothetical protein